MSDSFGMQKKNVLVTSIPPKIEFTDPTQKRTETELFWN